DVDSPTLTFSVVSGPAHGVVSITDAHTGAYTYVPAADYNGADSFTFKASDGALDSNTAVVSLTVTPVNDPPVARSDNAVTAQNPPVAVNVLANDTDVDGDSLTVTAVSQGAHGTVTNNGNGTLSYAPATNFTGTDTFTYTVSDGQGGSTTAQVNVTVNP